MTRWGLVHNRGLLRRENLDGNRIGGIGEQHDDRRLRRHARHFANESRFVERRHADSDAVNRSAIDLNLLIEVPRRLPDEARRH
jgi:hypothetical protein